MSSVKAAPQPASSIPDAVPDRDAVMARASGENFPVALWLLPQAVRRHLLAIYGFARLVDELGDAAAGDRLALLDWLDGEVSAIYAARAPAHPVMRRLVATVRAADIPDEPFRRLIQANRQDQTVHAYETFEELAAYCELSANPVGRLVLHVFGAYTAERVWLSDQVCTGLQLAEHWQDIAEDYGSGRVYVPREDLVRFDCRPEDFGLGVVTPEFRRLLAFEVDRAEAHLDRGAPLSRLLPGTVGLAVGAFMEGGRAALQAIRDADYDVLARAPRPTLRHKARAVRALARLWMSW